MGIWGRKEINALTLSQYLCISNFPISIRLVAEADRDFFLNSGKRYVFNVFYESTDFSASLTESTRFCWFSSFNPDSTRFLYFNS